MKRLFVICVDNSTKEQQDTVTEFLKEEKGGYWHWFSDLWLVTDKHHKWTSKSLRDHLNSIIPGAHKIVIQIDGDNTWSGFGNNNMFTWMKKHWSCE